MATTNKFLFRFRNENRIMTLTETISRQNEKNCLDGSIIPPNF